MSTTFRPYNATDRDACLAIFDANCPAFFAPNERPEYLAFLAAVDDYTVCLLDGTIAGAYGLAAHGDDHIALRWILLSPAVQGRGLGSQIMLRVVDEARRRGVAELQIAASDKSAPFFVRSGAVARLTTVDGWGPGMHRVDMILTVC